jgi:hypothetical protein
MHKPTRSAFRNGSGVLFLAAGGALVTLAATDAATESPFPAWWFIVSWVLLAIGAVGFIASFFGTEKPTRSEELLERIVLLLEQSAPEKLTTEELAQGSGASRGDVTQAVAALRGQGRVAWQGQEVSLLVTPANEQEQAMPITPVKSPQSDRGPVTRREIVYDDEARKAGEEIVHESRDAIATPKTVEAKAPGPGPTTNQRWNKPGWIGSCETVPLALSGMGKGVRLTIRATEGIELELGCMVIHESGARYQGQPSVFEDDGPRRERKYLWPAQFEPKPPIPWPEGVYAYTWIGTTWDIGEDSETQELARGTFRIEANGALMCL